MLFEQDAFERPGIDNPWAVPRCRPVVLDPAVAERGCDWKGTYLEASLDYAAEDAAPASLL